MAFRSLRKTPGLAITIVVLLGFGIGANAALYSVVRAVLLRPIPGVARSGELVRVTRTQDGKTQNNQSYPDYVDFRDQSHTVTDLTASRAITMRLDGPPARIANCRIVSANFFQALGVRAAAGRLFSAADEGREDAVAVVSEAFWKRHWNADPRAIGGSLKLNGYPFTIAGVVAASFEGVEFGEHTEIWVPMWMVSRAMPRAPGILPRRNAGWLTWYGRVHPGIAMSDVRREWDQIAARLDAAYPATNRGRRFDVYQGAAMDEADRAEVSRFFSLLFGAVGLILAIACGNVANLMLARAAGRTREMAIRLALGASRWRLVRQVAGESVLLAGASAALGLLLAPWMAGLLSRLWRQDMPAAVTDWRVVGFAAGVALLCVLVFGLAPAWAASSTHAAAAMREGSIQTGRARSGWQHGFAVAQVALSTVLVIASGLVFGSMRRIAAIQPGYEAKGVVMASVDSSLSGLSAEQGAQLFADILREVSAMPGVRSASLAKSSPAVDWSDRVAIDAGMTDRNIVAAGYFHTLGIQLVAGRNFSQADGEGAARVAIVSQALAARLWKGANAIGQQIRTKLGEREQVMEVVGVAADSRYRSVLKPPSSLLYVPLSQNFDSITRVIAAVDREAEFKTRLRQEMQRLHPELPLLGVSTMREQIEQSLWQRQAIAAALSLFGALALVLACTGIHGVVAYLAAQRRREMGIRIALGAARADILRTVVGHALLLTLAGVVIGLALGMWVRPAMASVIYGGGAGDGVTFAAVAAAFVAVGALAASDPAIRAAAVEPSVALRCD